MTERLAEILLFLLPVALFVVWRLISIGRGPSPSVLIAMLAILVLTIASLLWMAGSNSLRRGQVYVPAHLSPSGDIVPGGSAPPHS